MNQPLMGDYMLIPNHISLKISFAVSPLLQLFHKIVAIKKKKTNISSSYWLLE